MTLASRVFEALRSGLVVALLAPLFAGFALTLALVAFSSAGFVEHVDTSVASLLLLLVGVASGAYFLGGIPAFVAGLALPALRTKLSSAAAASCTGVVGTLVYLGTLGSHLFGQPHPVRSVLTICVPALIGTAVAALAVPHRDSEA